MKKSIAIVSIFLVTVFCSSLDEKDGSTVTKMEITTISSSFQNHLISLSAGFSCSQNENGPDPPRQDPWQWREAVGKIIALLKQFSAGK